MALTRLWLAEHNLSGEIAELGKIIWPNQFWLGDLYLGGNQLVGCIPEDLRSVPGNDFPHLSLPFCNS